MNPLARARAAMRELEFRRAKNSLAIYAALQIPQDVEEDETEVDESLERYRGMEKLSMAARYVPADHHRLLIDKLEKVEQGKIKRLMIFEPPGSAKSTYGSVIYPSWYLGKHPKDCVIQGSYNSDLADRFGRRARNTFASPVHKKVFGNGLAKDSKAAGEWTTEQGGEYFAFGMKTGVTGRRADGVIIDDPLKGRKEADSKSERDRVWDTYIADVRTRMKPGAWIVYIATRWHEDDPAGRILPKTWNGESGWVTARDGERWYVLCLPAVIETEDEARKDPLKRAVGDILWPEWFTPEMFAQEKIIQGSRNWNALYQQKPKPDEGAILKRLWWKAWNERDLPKVEYVVQVYDTAFEEDDEADESARTTWGIFQHTTVREVAGHKVSQTRYCCLLMEAWHDRVEFPELKAEAKAANRKFKPDLILIEKKASGHSLIQELKRAGLPIRRIEVDRSKLSRAYAAQIVLEDGCVWYPASKQWPQEVIDLCARATFIKGDPGLDVPDTCVHAWNWLRRKYHLQLSDDDEPEDDSRYAPKAGGPMQLG